MNSFQKEDDEYLKNSYSDRAFNGTVVNQICHYLQWVAWHHVYRPFFEKILVWDKNKTFKYRFFFHRTK